MFKDCKRVVYPCKRFPGCVRLRDEIGELLNQRCESGGSPFASECCVDDRSEIEQRCEEIRHRGLQLHEGVVQRGKTRIDEVDAGLGTCHIQQRRDEVARLFGCDAHTVGQRTDKRVRHIGNDFVELAEKCVLYSILHRLQLGHDSAE